MTDDDEQRGNRALWDLWQLLHRLRDLLTKGKPLPPADTDWEDTVPIARPPKDDE